jgi:hypothetical protein
MHNLLNSRDTLGPMMGKENLHDDLDLSDPYDQAALI